MSLVSIVENGGSLEDSGFGFERGLEAFGTFLGNNSERTRDSYLKAAIRFLKWCYERGINHPDKETVEAYRNEIKARMKATSVNANIVAIRQFFHFLADKKVYQDIALGVKGVKSQWSIKGYLDADGARKLLSVIDRSTKAGRRDYALVLLLVVCGLRTIEAERSNWGDLEDKWGGKVLKVQGKGRTAKGDKVKVPAVVVEALLAYKADLDEESAAEDRPMFQSYSRNSLGQRMTTRSISGTAKAYLKAAGFDSASLTAHSLRHTAVTLALRSGLSLRDAQMFARHTNINTTTIYAHDLEEEKNQCSANVCGAIFG